MLEPYAVKVARTVLRRERRGNPPDLSGLQLSRLLRDNFINDSNDETASLLPGQINQDQTNALKNGIKSYPDQSKDGIFGGLTAFRC